MIRSDDQLQRPYEKVLAYLEQELNLSSLAPGSRLPTTRHISGKLRVSSGTVRNVFSRLANEGRVRMEVGNGTFWLGDRRGKKQYAFGVNRREMPGSGGGSIWSFQVFGGMLQASLSRGLSVNFVPVDLDNWSGNGQSLPSIDGMVLLPSAHKTCVMDQLDRRGIPYVSLNPPDCGATANFVSPDYFGASLTLGRILRRLGRRRIMLYVRPMPAFSVSCRLRQAGLLAGLAEEEGVLPQFEMLAAGSESVADLRKEWILRRDAGQLPDVVYCAGDQMAVDVLNVARELGIRVPDELSVIGGNGLLSTSAVRPALTATAQPLARVGEQILEMLIKRTVEPALQLPGIVVPMDFAIGGTTRDAENELLQTQHIKNE